VGVLVRDLQDPCFRHLDEQAACPEIHERLKLGGSIPMNELLFCSSLNPSWESRVKRELQERLGQPVA